MRIDFTMSAGGSIDIDPSALEDMTKREKKRYIEEAVTSTAYEEADSSLNWEISEE